MTPAIIERLKRWRGWLKSAYIWTDRDEEMFNAALERLGEGK
jgi:hypothetical protein